MDSVNRSSAIPEFSGAESSEGTDPTRKTECTAKLSPIGDVNKFPDKFEADLQGLSLAAIREKLQGE